MRVQLVILTILRCSLGCLFGSQFEHPDYYVPHYKTKHKKELECSCGEVGNRDPSLPLPWHVLILHRDTDFNNSRSRSFGRDTFCSGTIINSKIILTSVSCLLKLGMSEIKGDASKGIVLHDECIHLREELRVWILADDLSTSSGLEVADLYYHPKYLYHLGVYSKIDFDVAMLALKTPLEFTRSAAYSPVCLPHQSAKSNDLDGLEVSRTQLMRDSSMNSTSVQDQRGQIITSFTYPLMKCRVNAETKWISDRFLCSEAEGFTSEKIFSDVGSALLASSEGKSIQFGIVSWKTYLPLINSKKPLLLSTNVAHFLRKIDEFSEKNKGQWCKFDWSGKTIKKWAGGSNPETILKQTLNVGKPWEGITSDFRNIRTDCVCGKPNSMDSRGRIQGGSDSTPYEYGWMVQLLGKTGSGGGQLCGGTIINSRLVLTAAHCVFTNNNPKSISQMLKDKVQPQNMQVRIHRYGGPQERDDKSRVLKVEAIIHHPEYSLEYADNDLALIILKEHIDFHKHRGKVSPLCFAMTNESIELDGRSDAKILGWGRTKVRLAGSHAVKLQELVVSIASRSDCMAILREYRKKRFGDYEALMEHRSKICAGTFSLPRDYKDPAHGDSGGPLFIPVTPQSSTMIHVAVASMITMNTMEDFLKSNVKTLTIYTKLQDYQEFVDYYSLIADANWCSRGI